MTRALTLLAGRHIVRIELELDEPRSVGVLVSVDGEPRWSSEEPGWRDIGVGATSTFVYVWSARRVVVIPTTGEPATVAAEADEDILLPFAAEVGFVLVCESSVRLMVDGDERCRLDFPDVLEFAAWRGDTLEVRDASGTTHGMAVERTRLRVLP